MTEVQLDIDTLKREGTEIARYRISAGERVVIGRRASGGAELLDTPASGQGLAYYVDRGWQDSVVMEAFIRDYLKKAELLDEFRGDREHPRQQRRRGGGRAARRGVESVI